MANIYVEAKGPKGVNAKESLLPAAVIGFTRGLAVTYGSDQYHAALIAAAAAAAIGLIEEDAISVQNPISVIEFGQTVAQIGATVAELQALTTNAAGQLVPAQPGQPVIAIALEPQTYVSPGSYANVFVLGAFGYLLTPGSPVSYLTASGALPIATGTYVLNGAAALAMTLANPTNAQDGTTLYIVALTAHAHTVTTPADAIYGTKDTVTYAAKGDFIQLEAVNGGWMVKAIGGPTPAALSEV
jgi:hypothetical protein